MARPGGPPPPKVRPADCPKDGAYIKMVDAGGAMQLPGDPPFPIIFEGGEGNDSVTVLGGPGKGILMDGGKGDDSLTVGDERGLTIQSVLPVAQLTPTTTLILGAFAITLAAVVIIAWRMLSPPRF